MSKRMPELVVPSVEDAERIAALINARSQAPPRVSEETAAGVAEWFDLPVPRCGGGHAARGRPRRVGRGLRRRQRAGGRRPEGHGRPARAPGRGSGDARALRLGERRARSSGSARRVGSSSSRTRTTRPLARAARGDGLQRRPLLVRDGARHRGRRSQAPVWPRRPRGQDARSPGQRGGASAPGRGFCRRTGSTPRLARHVAQELRAAGVDSGALSVVWDGDEIAGLCLTRPAHGEDEPIGWIGDLAVRAPWRRRGLGERFCSHAFRLFAQAGKRARRARRRQRQRDGRAHALRAGRAARRPAEQHVGATA